tara:strand:- start:197 stop:601 length:405 start_codon:yes stop_codon:yes gene_type:complete
MSEVEKQVGRPTKYNEEIQKFADDYIENYLEYEIVNNNAVPNSLPSQCDLAFKLKVHRETIANWGKSHRQFFDTLERINQKQEIMLSKFGLNRGYDSSITKMHMVNLTNYKDKVETVNTNQEIILRIDNDDVRL